MEPFEVMTSARSRSACSPSSRPRASHEVLRLCARWEVARRHGHRPTPVDADGGRLRILDGFDGEVLADVPASSLHAAPLSTTGPAAARPTAAASRAATDPGLLPIRPTAPPRCATRCSYDTTLGLVASTTTSCSSTPSRPRRRRAPCCG